MWMLLCHVRLPLFFANEALIYFLQMLKHSSLLNCVVSGLFATLVIFTNSHTHIHMLMLKAAMQLIIRSNLGFRILLKYTSTCSWGDLNQSTFCKFLSCLWVSFANLEGLCISLHVGRNCSSVCWPMQEQWQFVMFPVRIFFVFYCHSVKVDQNLGPIFNLP